MPVVNMLGGQVKTCLAWSRPWKAVAEARYRHCFATADRRPRLGAIQAPRQQEKRIGVAKGQIPRFPTTSMAGKRTHSEPLSWTS